MSTATKRRFGISSLRVLLIGVLLLGGISGALGVGSGFVTASLQASSVTATATGSSYWVAGSSPRAQLESGQNADILLSGIGFNNTGGPSLFNHLGGIASDGKHLVVADRNNNRILIWNTLPTGNVPPDLVLGQKSFTTNNPGTGLDQLNWPTAVAMTSDGKVIVADTVNNRILIWNTFPSSNDQPADIAIDSGGSPANPLRNIHWPWGVWTNGTFLVASSTFSATVLIWRHFPTVNNQSADYYITAGGEFGTPRDIISDSKSLLIYDHNTRASGCNQGGTLVWKNFPSSDSAPDYCIPSLEFLAGAFSSDGKLWATTVLTNSQGQPLLSNQNGEGLFMWNSLPTSAGTPPDMMNSGSNGFRFFAGDTSGIAIVGSEMFISLDNGNKIVVYNQLPNSSTQNPDFAIGAPDIYTNTLSTNFIMSNPQPITNGKSLFVVSDFDEMLYVYKNIPDQSNAHPDLVYNLASVSMQPIQGALYGNTFVLVGQQGGQQTVYIWNSLPFGQAPDAVFQGSIGSATFQQLAGVAIDGKYLYLSDSGANKIYVFQGVPTSSSSNPVYALSFNDPERLSSDGNYLVVTATDSGSGGHVGIYTINNLSANSQPVIQGGSGQFNIPRDAAVAHGQLFVGDTGFNRVQVWNNITSAMSGSNPDILLGCTQSTAVCIIDPEIGRNLLFWPAAVAFDGSFLWVGEYKFSEQLLRFSGAAPPGSQTFTLSYDGNSYSIPVSTSTSTVTDLAYNPLHPALRVNVTEPTPSGSMTITYPAALLNGTLTATLDGAQTSFKQSQNGTSSFSVTVSYAHGAHAIILSCTTCSATSSTTSTTTTSSSSSSTSTLGTPGGQPSVNISPSSGSSGTVVTISGGGLIPNHTYRYCYQSGSPPMPPNPLVPCSAGASDFSTLSDGSIPSSPAVTMKIVGPSGQYTVEISDTSSPFVMPFNFMITGGSSTTYVSSSVATISQTTSMQTAPGQTTSITTAFTTSSAMTTSSTPDYTLWGGIAAVIVVVAGLGAFALRKKK